MNVRFVSILSLFLLLFGPAAAFASNVDVNGSWVMVVDLGDAAGGEATFDFAQDGDVLSGTYAGAFGSAKVTGSVTGRSVEFSYIVDVEGSGEPVTVMYRGVLSESGALSGTCDYGKARATFFGTRRN